MINNIKHITNDLLRKLANQRNECSISVYLPTHQAYPDNQQDIIVYKNLLKILKGSLQNKYSELEVENYMSPFYSIEKNEELWNNTLAGLAILSGGDELNIFYLQMPVEELVIVAHKFHTKPIRQSLQFLVQYHVLSLNRDRFKLYEGNRFALKEVILAEEIPQNIEGALGYELTDKHSSVASYGGTGENHSAMHHGDGGRKDQIDSDTLKFFRIVASTIEKSYSRPSGIPLILAALPEHHHLFHEVNKNLLLQKEGILHNTKALSNSQLAVLAWEVMRPHYEKQMMELSSTFNQALSDGKGSDNLTETIKAIALGKVETLLLEQNRIIPGEIIDTNTGKTQTGDLMNPEIGDILDDLTELAIEKGTKVIILPLENMPTKSGIASIFRY